MLTTRRRAFVLVLAGFVMAAVVSVWLVVSKQHDDEHWVRHTDAVMLRLADVLADVVDSETSERGYVITGDRASLAPYERARARLSDDLAALTDLVADNPAEATRLGEVARRANEELAAIDAIVTTRSRNPGEAIQLVVAGGDRTRTDDLRSRIADMRSAELALLAQREAAATRSDRATTLMIPVVLSALLAVLGYLWWSAQLEVARRRTAEAEASRLSVAADLDRERRQRDDFREQFLGIVGHDLRAPLTAIGLEAQMSRRSNDVEAQHHSAELILASTRRMARMVEQLLDVTHGRLGAGIPVVRRDADLAMIVREVVAETARATPERVRLSAPPTLACVVDADRVAQVVSNLVANALTHGRGLVTIRLAESTAHGASLTVHNDGPTIPPEALAHLFEPFRSGRGESDGLGLGLYIVREIVRGHAGEIEVTSTPDLGTSVAVTLPRDGR